MPSGTTRKHQVFVPLLLGPRVALQGSHRLGGPYWAHEPPALSCWPREIDRVLSEAGSDGRTISTSSYCPISARSGGTTSSSTASTSSTAVSCEAKGLAYKFARFWALPYIGEPAASDSRELVRRRQSTRFLAYSVSTGITLQSFQRTPPPDDGASLAQSITINIERSG